MDKSSANYVALENIKALNGFRGVTHMFETQLNLKLTIPR